MHKQNRKHKLTEAQVLQLRKTPAGQFNKVADLLGISNTTFFKAYYGFTYKRVKHGTA